MIVMIDNYDSFVYNLYQLIGSIRSDIEVYRNDKITVEDIEAMKPEAIVISPDRADRKMQETVWRLYRHLQERSQSLGYVWDIRLSVPYTVELSPMQRS